MAEPDKTTADQGMVERLSKRGEEALNRLIDELGKNPRVTEALSKAMEAKGRLDDATRKALGQAGLAAADELKDLRKHVEKLEKRLVKLEGGSGSAKPKSRAKGSESKRTTSAKRGTTPAKTEEETGPSPSPGRSIGGGTGGGSSAG
jgi:hypothetical protein